MNTAIYYFSGTGNSLAVARDIAEKMAAKRIALPAVMEGESLRPEAEVIGIVFPVYHGGLPLIVHRAVLNMAGLEGRYLFGVCTYGDSPGLAITTLGRLIQARGGKLAAGFAVHMPYNYLTPPAGLKGFFSGFGLREIAKEKQHALFAEWKAKLETVVGFVQARAAGRFETAPDLKGTVVDFFNLRDSLGKSVWLKIAGYEQPSALSFLESRQLMDVGFRADERCNGCGLCARVCPVGNIALVDGRPAWQHRCEQCFACLQWCPQAALQFREATAAGKRYHHPEVTLADMLRQAG